VFMRMIYDEKLAQAAYLFGCQKTGEAIVIDPERDIDRYLDIAAENDLRITAAAETHIHADFLSGARELAERVGATLYLSAEGGPDWSYRWLDKRIGGGTYDHHFLHDGDVFAIGNIEFKALHTPGHTPEHLAFLVTDRGAGADEPIGIATGDFVFVGDLGRPDLLETAAGQAGAREPAARQLHATTRVLDNLPDFIQVWPAHGAGSACGKALGAVPASTIGYEKRFNPALKAAASQASFVDFILSGQPEPPLYFADMKRLNRDGPPVLGALPAPPRLATAELRDLDAAAVTLVDTRPWDDFRAAHVPGSLSLPLIRSFPTDAGSLIARDTDIYLIVAPDRLDEAVRDLIRIGLDHIKGWFHPADVHAYAEQGGPVESTKQVNAQDAAALIERGEARVLDVRRATEFAEGRLPGAINIAHTRLASRLDELPPDVPLLVNCRSGVRSARASAFLQRLGREVINLEGGFLAWSGAEQRVES